MKPIIQSSESKIEITRLSSGLTVITDKMPDVRSATLGFWFKRGSRNEPGHLNGICHFIEHAVFKGSRKRDALEIAVESDRLGGNLNAFTSHEETAFLIKVVDQKIPQAFDLIADMIVNPIFDERELSRERRVIIEEIKMVEDSPEDILAELFLAKFFPANTLGLPIEGTRQTVKTFKSEPVRRFHAENYTAENLVITSAGNVDHKEIVKLADRFFPTAETSAAVADFKKPESASPILLKKKQNLEQTHLIIAVPWISSGDERRYAASLFTSILGDGNSSRLWQNIREKRGLAYSVGAGADSFADSGLFSIYAGTSPANLGEVIDLAVGEIRRIKRDGVSLDELNLAKEQTVASILLGLESTAARAESLAHHEMVHGRQIPVEETLRKIEAVSIDEIKELVGEYFHTEKISLAAIGNLKGLRVPRERLDVS